MIVEWKAQGALGGAAVSHPIGAFRGCFMDPTERRFVVNL